MSVSETRRNMLEKVMKEHGYQESALLEILYRAQEIYGYLSKDLLMDISQSLDLPPSHVFGVATFYSLFKLTEPGEHIVTGCLGTACYVKGVEDIMQAIEQEFKIKRGETTPDRKLSVFVTRCIGACAMAPNIVVDDEVIGKATKESVLDRIHEVLKGDRKP
ncbi:MAG TPA: NAD(P)H-dependent oxidoreductase subunit E [Candidatus Sulfotelmatobacter sp.]|nr:NAD(P)H-dependent oxidoreductase subunit E [Candidatus Sulfotelmatobacter sp.]